MEMQLPEWKKLADRAPARPSIIRSLFETLPLPVTRLAEDGTVEAANAEAARIAGLGVASLRGRRFWMEAVHPDDRWKLTGALRRAAAGQAETVEVRCRLRQEDRALELSFLPDEVPGRGGAVVAAVDVTEEKRCEEERELRARYRAAEAALRRAALGTPTEAAFLEAALRLLAETAGADRVLLVQAGAPGASWATRAAWKREGVPPAGDPGEAARRLADVPERLHVRAPAATDADAHLLGALAAGELAAVRLEREGPPETFVVLARARGASTWSEPQLLAVEGLVHHFETLWAWMLAATRYRQTIAAIDACLFTYVLPADAPRRFHFVTHQVEALTGYDQEALLGGDPAWPSLLDPDDLEAVRGHERALRAGEESRVVYRIRRRDGAVRWLREHGTPARDAAGRVVVSGLVTDVTDQKAAEAALVEAKQAAESASELKSAFVATMSHEIRTPLGAVNGFADLLEQELAEVEERTGFALTDEVHEFLQAIRDNAGRLLALVNDLFDLSNLEIGAVHLNRTAVPLDALVRRAAQKVADALARKGVELRLDLAGSGLAVIADAQRLGQVVDHLLANAAKFTDAGSVTVRTRRRPAGEVLLEISDTGVGIAEEYREALFTPFMQEDRRLNRRFAGTGLGLALVKRLLDYMGGRIEVESRKAEGSTFRVYLPAADDGSAFTDAPG